MNSQKQAVFLAVTSYFGDKFENGIVPSKEDKSKIVDALVEQANVGFEIKSEQENVRSYCIGLLNNHLRKDVRLNGGEKYVAKNPGSRAGQSDPQIKEARKLLKTMAEGSVEANQIKSFIDNKIATNKAEKATDEIDVDALPEELKGLVG